MAFGLKIRQRDFLESDFLNEEIKRAVWDCGGDHAPGPDGFMFKFIKTFWNVIESDVIVGCISNSRASILVNGSSTTEFKIFKGLRKGDPLSPFLFILYMESLHVITYKAVNIGMFKGASIREGNLDILHLFYADDAIFVGEWSQHNAHNFICMLRCIYLVSGLKINVYKSKLVGVSVFNKNVTDMATVLGCGAAKLPMTYLGVPVGCSNLGRVDNWKCIVQKFTAKMSQWKARLLSVGGRVSLIKSVVCNLPTYYLSLYKMPTCVQKKLEYMRNKFFVGGDLGDKKVTWVKWNVCLASKALGGLGVSDENVIDMATVLGCGVAKLPMTYLGGDLGDKKVTWVKWNVCLASKALGGLSIESIYALNMSILFKCIWRFCCNPNDLWARLQSKGVNLLASCKRSLGDGMNISFWDETWCGDSPLNVLFPRVYALEGDKKCKVAHRINVSNWNMVLRRAPRGGVESSQLEDLKALIQNILISDNKDGWKWSLDSNGFSVASARKYIDEHILPCGLSCTRWNKGVPIKVNVFLWRLNLDKLPSLVNMDRKGMDIDSLLCPVCGDHVESVDHLFFSCGMARELWRLLARWCDLDITSVANIAEWFLWVDACKVTKTARYILEGIAATLMWSIWNFHNALIFSDCKPKKATLWDSIVSQSLRITSRIGWLGNLIDNVY
ncbi:RNA-directed DNA polymerase, eukaryota, reverse transcriptase zinc-binding domain protein [Tanacetum coccineum]